MTQSLHFGLPGVGKRALLDQRSNTGQQGLLGTTRDLVLELIVRVKMILQRPLTPARHKPNLGLARGQSLFDAILNQRFVHNRQHFFGHRLRGRQKPSAIPRRWK